MLPPSATRALRLAFGVLFLWLGVLKVIPGMSPAEDLMRATMPSFLPIDAFIRFAAVWEIVIGVGFLTGVLRRLVVLMTFATMGVTLSILWLAPQRIWTAFPLQLSFEGVYVFKDLVIVASAIALAVATVQERPELEGRVAIIARRLIPRAVDAYLSFERGVTTAVTPWVIPLMRLALGVVFIWFGLLNVLDPMSSPTWPMVEAVVSGDTGALTFRIWGVVGIVAGVGVALGRYERLAVGLLLAMMVTSGAWFILAPDVTFQQPPLVLSLEGQHIVKNLVLASAAIVVLRARPVAARSSTGSLAAPEPEAVQLS
jgi:uncharacterized membrane protein YkgB